MGLAEELIAIKMRLSGATSYQREMQRNTAVTTEYGDAAERAGAQAKSGSVGVDAMAASSTKGAGALAKMKTVGTGMKSTGRAMTTAFTVPVLLLGAASIKMALDFNASMALIQTQAGASAHELAYLERGVKSLAASGKTGFTDNELAEGLYAIRSAGIQGARALETLRTASDFAEVGQAGLAETTKALVSAQNSGIKGTKNLHKEIGTLNATIGAGQMHMGELNSAIGTGFLGTAKALGINLYEVGGALSFLTREGTPASAAATRLRMAWSLIANPTEKAQKALQGIGLSQQALALKMRGPNGVVEGLKVLHKHLEENFDMSTKVGKVGATQMLAEAFGGAKSGGTILQLLGNMKSLEQTTAAVHNNTGQIAGDIRKAESTGEEQLKHTWSQFNNTLVELGQVLIPVVIPALRSLAHIVMSAVEWFSKLPEPVQKVGIYFGMILAVAGPMLSMFGMAVIGVDALIAAFAELDIEMGGLPIIMGVLTALAVGFSGIFSSSSASVTRMASATNNLKRYMEGQRQAGQHLVKTEQVLARDKRKHATAAHDLKQAQQHLTNVVRKYGKESQPAIRAEQALAQKRWSLIKATHALSKANRQHGIALQMTKQLTKEAVLEGRHEINLLNQKKQQFDQLWTKEQKTGASAQRLNQIAEWGGHVNERLEGAHKNLNKVLLEAAEKVGPKYAHFLQHASRETIEFGSAVAEAASRTEQIIEAAEGINNIGRIHLGEQPLPPGSGIVPHHHHPGHHHKGPKGRPNASVNMVRTRSGPSPTKLYTRRDGGAGGSGRGTPVHVHATFNVDRRKFGEAMAMALIDEDVNS